MSRYSTPHYPAAGMIRQTSNMPLTPIHTYSHLQEMRSYVNREKAVMTASHVFTWGGRHTYAGPEHGLSR